MSFMSNETKKETREELTLTGATSSDRRGWIAPALEGEAPSSLRLRSLHAALA